MITPARLRTVVGACTVAVAVIVGQVARWGPLSRLDVSAAREARRLRPDRDLFEITVMFGLRGIILTVCLPYLAWRCWKDRLRWPAVGFVTVLLLETGMLGAMKVAVGRSFPYQGDMVLEAGFLAFPSGHAGNVVSLWGYMAWYLSLRRPRLAPVLWVSVAAATATVGVSSWLLRTHWPTDLIVGFLMGGIALIATIAAVQATGLSQTTGLSQRATAGPARAVHP
ncbi:MAG: phosphatase PAP2 family protein [Actinomycetota bacterium]